jgi:hypothetical protein
MQREHELIHAHPETFRPGFWLWLTQSEYVWREVKSAADRTWHAGVRQWSMDRVLQHLRHDRALNGRHPLKIDDRWSSSMARLYVMLHPERKDLFEFRQRRNAVVGKIPETT